MDKLRVGIVGLGGNGTAHAHAWWAHEKADLKNGFEGLDPDAPGPGLEETPESKAERLKTAAKAGK